jgi:Fic family protein
MTEKIFKIYSPPMQMEKLQGPVLQNLLNDPEIKKALMRADEDYLHWQELRHKDWIPKRFTSDKELFWTLLKIHRLIGSINTPIKDSNNHTFRMNTGNYNKFLHVIDKEMGGNFMGIPGLSENDKRQFITRNIIEESIASSQLEGANTSRAVAKKMLIEGRKPINHSEIMIVNNHRTMLKIEQELHKEKLSWKLICELHSMITDQTIEKDKQGTLRETFDKNGNKLVIKPWDDRTIAYIAPDKEFVEKELSRLIDFANDKEEPGIGFIHPLIKAIMLHFWIGLLHPFEDGNGRLARILFYWYMLRNEYWAFAYLSLSEKIKKSHKQYAEAYIYSEQDDCDLTYFIDYNINKLKLARTEFQSFIKKKVKENQAIISLTQQTYNFNERQIKLLQHLNQKMESRTNIVAHQKLYSIAKLTAINDLKHLVKEGLLIKKKQGRNIYYYPTEQISKLFKFN